MTREKKHYFPECPENLSLTEDLKQDFSQTVEKYLGQAGIGH